MHRWMLIILILVLPPRSQADLSYQTFNTCAYILRNYFFVQDVVDDVRDKMVKVNKALGLLEIPIKDDFDMASYLNAKKLYQNGTEITALPKKFEEQLAYIESHTEQAYKSMGGVDPEITFSMGQLDLREIFVEGGTRKRKKLRRLFQNYDLRKKHTKQQLRKFISELYILQFGSSTPLKKIFLNPKLKIQAHMARIYLEGVATNGITRSLRTLGHFSKIQIGHSLFSFRLIQEYALHAYFLKDGLIPVYLHKFPIEPSGILLRKVVQNGFDQTWPQIIKHHGLKAHLHYHYHALKGIYSHMAFIYMTWKIYHYLNPDKSKSLQSNLKNRQQELEEGLRSFIENLGSLVDGEGFSEDFEALYLQIIEKRKTDLGRELTPQEKAETRRVLNEIISK